MSEEVIRQVERVSWSHRKFPPWVQYANEWGRFAKSTRQNQAWALLLVCSSLPQQSSEGWAPSEVWGQLRAHQDTFRALVERLAGGLFTSTDIREVNEHGQHFSIEVKGSPPRRTTPSTEHPPVSNRALAARRVAKEPIDALYDQLTHWLLDDTEQFLTACALCRRFFLQRAAASTTCSPACKRQVDPALKENNAKYQQRFRQKQIDKDLARVREAKAQWLERTGNLPRLRTLLGALGMSRKRWATLQKADREQHGTLHDTALTKPAGELRQRRRTPSRNPEQTAPTDMAPPIAKTEPSAPLLPAPRPRQRRQTILRS